jgi:hypothetical protein
LPAAPNGLLLGGYRYERRDVREDGALPRPSGIPMLVGSVLILSGGTGRGAGAGFDAIAEAYLREISHPSVPASNSSSACS